MRLRDSASDSARGLGAIYDPACLRDPARASEPGSYDDSARLSDSTSDPAQGLGATYNPACLRDPVEASGLGRHDCVVSLRDSAKASGLGHFDYSESLSDLTHGFRDEVTESGSINVAISGWSNTDVLRKTVRREYQLNFQAFGQTRSFL